MFNTVIMKTEQFSAETLQAVFEEHPVVTMPQLQHAVGCAPGTMYRKLKELSYLSSYSHAGQYYTLPAYVSFNEQGLWTTRGIRFSRHGTLKDTVEAWCVGALEGYFEAELAQGLGVGVRIPLIGLCQEDRIGRDKVSGRYLYGSAEASVRLRQTLTRRSREGHALPGPEVLQHEIKAAILLFFSLLNEKQRRLYAGVESLKVGPGGDQAIAQWLGLHPQTIAKGREELLARDIDLDRVRRVGAGRPLLEKKRPTS